MVSLGPDCMPALLPLDRRLIGGTLAWEIEVPHMDPVLGERWVTLPEIFVVLMPIGWPER